MISINSADLETPDRYMQTVDREELAFESTAFHFDAAA